MYCEYGCGQSFKFTLKNGRRSCSARAASCPENRKKNSQGQMRAYTTGVRIPAKDVYQSLPEETKQRMNWNKGNFSSTIFEYGGTGSHKAALIQERGHKCEDCGLEQWKTEKIPLELEHIDGDNRNNTKVNLKLLCCNCHALTNTWRGRNMNSGKVKVTDDELLTALKECSSIRKALQRVGLTPKGGNYERANRLLALVVK